MNKIYKLKSKGDSCVVVSELATSRSKSSLVDKTISLLKGFALSLVAIAGLNSSLQASAIFTDESNYVSGAIGGSGLNADWWNSGGTLKHRLLVKGVDGATATLIKHPTDPDHLATLSIGIDASKIDVSKMDLSKMDTSKIKFKYFNVKSTLADSEALGTNSIAIGPVAKAKGADSIAMGKSSEALSRYTTSIGHEAGKNANTYNGSVFLGYQAGKNLKRTGILADGTIYGTIAIGQEAGEDMKGDANVAIGSTAGISHEGSQNIYIGDTAATPAFDPASPSQSKDRYNNKSKGNRNITIGNQHVNDTIKNDEKNKSDFINDTISIGTLARASKSHSIAIGSSYDNKYAGAVANGIRSIAIGSSLDDRHGAMALGEDSISIGSGSSATTNYNIALGSSTESSGTNSVAIGKNAQATSVASIAIGDRAKSKNAGSIAIGQNSSVTGGGSAVAIGTHSSSVGSSSVSIGDHATSLGNESITIGGNPSGGTQGTTKSFAERGIAIGRKAQSGTSTSDKDSIALGTEAKALQTNSIAIGGGSSATTSYNIALGSNTESSGTDSIAIGKEAKALGYKSVAIGEGAESKNGGGIAIGQLAKATGGMSTVSIGTKSSAIGKSSISMGDWATSEGERSISIGANPNGGKVGKTEAHAIDGIAIGTKAK